MMRFVFILFFVCSFSYGQVVDRFTLFPATGGAVDVFPSGNAASADDANATTGWFGSCSTSCIEITSVANTDSEGGSYAINIAHIGGTESFRAGEINMTGLSLVPHTLTIRTRSVVGNISTQTVTVNNSTSVTNNVDYSSVSQGTWFESTIVFTPTSSTVKFTINVNAPGSGQGTSGQIQVSEITLVEN